ncbi:hypothetical protein [Salinispora cortesiana]|uniref:hypothetical protein n=1 Tax=Salinispora cortesiana TaxID=1305843 RepID=UPI0012BC68EC|nr:hypothetical protein [Salinispora cortesiana]
MTVAAAAASLFTTLAATCADLVIHGKNGRRPPLNSIQHPRWSRPTRPHPDGIQQKLYALLVVPRSSAPP